MTETKQKMTTENIVLLVAVVGIFLVGIAAMILGCLFPSEEWIKNIAFFLFGSATSPIMDIIKNKGLLTMKNTIPKMLLAGVIMGALSMTACNKYGIDAPQTTVDVVQENGKTCIEVSTKVCADNDKIDIPYVDGTCDIDGLEYTNE